MSLCCLTTRHIHLHMHRQALRHIAVSFHPSSRICLWSNRWPSIWWPFPVPHQSAGAPSLGTAPTRPRVARLSWNNPTNSGTPLRPPTSQFAGSAYAFWPNQLDTRPWHQVHQPTHPTRNGMYSPALEWIWNDRPDWTRPCSPSTVWLFAWYNVLAQCCSGRCILPAYGKQQTTHFYFLFIWTNVSNNNITSFLHNCYVWVIRPRKQNQNKQTKNWNLKF